MKKKNYFLVLTLSIVLYSFTLAGEETIQIEMTSNLECKKVIEKEKESFKDVFTEIAYKVNSLTKLIHQGDLETKLKVNINSLSSSLFEFNGSSLLIPFENPLAMKVSFDLPLTLNLRLDQPVLLKEFKSGEEAQVISKLKEEEEKKNILSHHSPYFKEIVAHEYGHLIFYKALFKDLKGHYLEDLSHLLGERKSDFTNEKKMLMDLELSFSEKGDLYKELCAIERALITDVKKLSFEERFSLIKAKQDFSSKNEIVLSPLCHYSYTGDNIIVITRALSELFSDLVSQLYSDQDRKGNDVAYTLKEKGFVVDNTRMSNEFEISLRNFNEVTNLTSNPLNCNNVLQNLSDNKKIDLNSPYNISGPIRSFLAPYLGMAKGNNLKEEKLLKIVYDSILEYTKSRIKNDIYNIDFSMEIVPSWQSLRAKKFKMMRDLWTPEEMNIYFIDLLKKRLGDWK